MCLGYLGEVLWMHADVPEAPGLSADLLAGSRAAER